MLENTLRVFLNPEPVRWIAGPVFQKELRVSSRRRRTYALRAGYIALLALYLGLAGIPMSFGGGRGAALRSLQITWFIRAMILAVAFFQWFATLLVTPAMLCTSISDEVKRRTLPVLFSTPISSAQIVLGKLLSKTFQILLLIALSLPLFAILRVYGGVPWEFLIASTSICLVSALFAGAVSMFLSVFNEKGYIVFFQTVFLLLGLTALGAWAFYRLSILPSAPGGVQIPGVIYPGRILMKFAAYSCSYAAMMSAGTGLLGPSAGGGFASYSWKLHCVVSLLECGVLVGLTAIFVRRAALRQAGASERKRRLRRARKGKKKIRPVGESPVFWKEKCSAIARHGIGGRAMFFILTFLLLGSYFVWREDLNYQETQSVYAFLLFLLSTLAVLGVASATITNEKEAGTWDLLLGTPLSRREIVWGKLRGVFYKTAPLWFLFFGHVALFTALGTLNPVLLLLLLICSVGTGFFLAAVGILASALTRSTTRALVAALFTAFVLWVVVPFFLSIGGGSRSLPVALTAYHPFIQVPLFTDAAVGNSFRISLPGDDWGLFETFVVTTISSLFYFGTGYIILQVASEKVRPLERYYPDFVPVGIAGGGEGREKEEAGPEAPA